MAPIIQDYVVLENTVYSLVGLDPFAEISFNRYTPAETNQELTPQENLFNDTNINFQLIPRAVLIGQGTTEANSYSQGDEIELSVGGTQHNDKIVSTESTCYCTKKMTSKKSGNFYPVT